MMRLTHHEANDIKEALRTNIPPLYLKQMFEAFRLLDRSLTETIGANWLDKTQGTNIPFDLYSVLVGNVVPDEDGILRTPDHIKGVYR